jgi:D-alanine-D-alanine ligase
MLRVGFTFDLRSDYLARGMSEEETAEFDSPVTIDAIDTTLRKMGFAVDRIGHIQNLVGRLAAGHRWDVVFNICEGVKGVAREAQVPAILEAFDIPYVFSDPLTLAAALDKGTTKTIVRAAGVPTPDFAVVATPTDIAKVDLPFPVFVKPVAEGSGKGVSARSHVVNRKALDAECRRLLYQFDQPVLVETFASGREFTVGITGTDDQALILGVMEVLPTKEAEAHGYGFDNKENYEGRFDYCLATDAEGKRAGEVGLAAYRAMRCRDGGRVDVRSNANGEPQFLEVNPLAGLNPERSDLIFIARFAGVTFDQLIGRIVNSCLARYPQLTGKKTGTFA